MQRKKLKKTVRKRKTVRKNADGYGSKPINVKIRKKTSSKYLKIANFNLRGFPMLFKVNFGSVKMRKLGVSGLCKLKDKKGRKLIYSPLNSVFWLYREMRSKKRKVKKKR